MTRNVGHHFDPVAHFSDSAGPIVSCCNQTSGRQGLRNGDIETLGQASDLSTLVASLVGIASGLTSIGRAFAFVRNSGSSTALLPSSRSGVPEGAITTALKRQPQLGEKLARGEHVVIEAARGTSSNGQRTQCLLVFPVAHRPEIMVLLCVAVPEGCELPARDLELLHLLCALASPLVAKIQQAQALEDKAFAREKVEQRATQLEEKVRGLAREQQEAQIVNHQMRSLLLANLAHELRTPLVAIRGYTKMILEGRAGEVSGAQREYLSIVAQNADRLVTLTDNLARLTSTQQLRTELFDIGLVLKESLDEISDVAAHNSIELISKIPSDPFQVFGDTEKLADVLSSLLLNALQYSESGGRIEVVLTRGRDGEAVIKISDTGPGIPKELVDKLFDSYKRPRNTSEVNRIGSGLAVVHDIVRLHGGRITVTSKMGEGSTFCITLPAIRIDARRLPGSYHA